MTVANQCSELQPELVGFHFGEVEPAARDRLERHLLDCRDCLAEFLELKRTIETAETDLAPSAKARARLRRAVAQEVRRPRRKWAWWERPVALLGAGAAVVAALFALQLIASMPGRPPHSLTTRPPAAPTQLR
jgi:anti-sigma factor RsiW